MGELCSRRACAGFAPSCFVGAQPPRPARRALPPDPQVWGSPTRSRSGSGPTLRGSPTRSRFGSHRLPWLAYRKPVRRLGCSRIRSRFASDSRTPAQRSPIRSRSDPAPAPRLADAKPLRPSLPGSPIHSAGFAPDRQLGTCLPRPLCPQRVFSAPPRKASLPIPTSGAHPPEAASTPRLPLGLPTQSRLAPPRSPTPPGGLRPRTRSSGLAYPRPLYPSACSSAHPPAKPLSPDPPAAHRPNRLRPTTHLCLLPNAASPMDARFG
ncbi:hypothetical protein FB390_5977 [Nocardia bhagyanarayanae]|uniref:Uncharacterized protein n=1 Tax=Nocardia bhagyanarayanae TaxID=1215925 RepID=A0A543EW74_9NOCA|nr:hypothetical protein FB390_5977 [Nocardia bhagyanarayanae]